MKSKKFKYGTLYCEDSLKFIKTLPDKSVDFILTDPPYEYQNLKVFAKKADENKNKIHKGINGLMNKLSEADILSGYDIKAYFLEFLRISKKPNWAIYCNQNQLFKYFSIIEELNLKFKLLKWIKTNPMPLNNAYLSDCEYCLFIYSSKGLVNYQNEYDSKKTYYLSASKGGSKKGEFATFHPTPKPITHTERLINKHTKKGDVVLDCFSGSGTVAVVCEREQRKWIAVELDKTFYEKSIERISIEGNKIKTQGGKNDKSK